MFISISTMGQRIVISESERKHIMNLYEAAPPSESVLVAKKNPFKYDEYADARRKYDKELKTGDRFFIDNSQDINQYYYNELVKFGNEIVESLYGKTIRDDDTLYKIIGKSDEDVSNDILSNFLNSKRNTWKNIILNPVTITTVSDVNEQSSVFNQILPKSPNLKLTNVYFPVLYISDISLLNFSDVVKKPNDLIVSFKGLAFWNALQLNEYGLNISNTIDSPSLSDYVKNKFNSELFKLSDIPDEFFEIREIKRQQTDF